MDPKISRSISASLDKSGAGAMRPGSAQFRLKRFVLALELTNGISIEVRSASFRRSRGGRPMCH
jgi:hypothetical protein